ncbi:MAG: hypothetical protein JNL28_07765 [Planctomycetes bacterium]|nr:hypothetical protein [Planctomycetota bacterium]
MLGPSVLFASAPFALIRTLSARGAWAHSAGMFGTALVLAVLSCVAVLGLLTLGVTDLFLN